MLDQAALVREIEELRKGPAARDPARWERLGPQLRQVSGIADHDPPWQRKAILRGTIERVLSDHYELMIILTAILGLHQQAQHDSPAERLEWAASTLHLGHERTAYRRASRAIEVFAQLAVESTLASRAAQLGLIVRSYQGQTDLTGDRARFVQRREIETTREVTALPGAFAIVRPTPGSEPRIDIRVTDGGIHCDDIRLRGCKVEYWVKQWRSLPPGATHSYEVEITIPEDLVAPYHLLTPLTATHTAEMSVVFNPTRLPNRVWRVDGVPRAEVEHCPRDSPDRLDPSGRFRTSHRNLQQGWSYGIRWEWT